MRQDGRKSNELRPIKITRNYTKYAEGSVLVEFGDTKVLCNATVEEKVPGFLKDMGQGWITAEYSMLPRSTSDRMKRDVSKGHLNGRATEIQRLIGRSIRSSVDLEALGERTVTLDCDVIQADGGTRTASITGAFIAFADACKYLIKEGLLEKMPFDEPVAAISCGIVGEEEMLDLCYVEDSGCVMDMNVVMTESGKIIEVQSTAEGYPVTKEQFNSLLQIAEEGIKDICKLVREELND